MSRESEEGWSSPKEASSETGAVARVEAHPSSIAGERPTSDRPREGVATNEVVAQQADVDEGNGFRP